MGFEPAWVRAGLPSLPKVGVDAGPFGDDATARPSAETIFSSTMEGLLIGAGHRNPVAHIAYAALAAGQDPDDGEAHRVGQSHEAANRFNQTWHQRPCSVHGAYRKAVDPIFLGPFVTFTSEWNGRSPYRVEPHLARLSIDI